MLNNVLEQKLKDTSNSMAIIEAGKGVVEMQPPPASRRTAVQNSKQRYQNGGNERGKQHESHVFNRVDALLFHHPVSGGFSLGGSVGGLPVVSGVQAGGGVGSGDTNWISE